MLAAALGPAIDKAAGRRPAGGEASRWARALRGDPRAIAAEGVEYTLTPFKDKEFSRQQADKIRALIAPAPRSCRRATSWR